MKDKVHIKQLENLASAHWVLNLYPTAYEAGGTFISSKSANQNRGIKGEAVDPVRAADEASRRASSKIRRYAAANLLNRLGTLTYKGEGCHDQRLARAHISEFFTSLKKLTGGKNFPYVWVPEWHPSGHGIHIHFAIGRYIKRSFIEQSWPHGFVHIKLIGDLPTGSKQIDEARISASYLSKYVSKSFLDEKRIFGRHRYDLAQGFTPKIEKIVGDSPKSVIALASEYMGSEPKLRWSSNDVENWKGAPAFWMQW